MLLERSSHLSKESKLDLLDGGKLVGPSTRGLELDDDVQRLDVLEAIGREREPVEVDGERWEDRRVTEAFGDGEDVEKREGKVVHALEDPVELLISLHRRTETLETGPFFGRDEVHSRGRHSEELEVTSRGFDVDTALVEVEVALEDISNRAADDEGSLVLSGSDFPNDTLKNSTVLESPKLAFFTPERLEGLASLGVLGSGTMVYQSSRLGRVENDAELEDVGQVRRNRSGRSKRPRRRGR